MPLNKIGGNDVKSKKENSKGANDRPGGNK
jgi:hypothetical protein